MCLAPQLPKIELRATGLQKILMLTARRHSRSSWILTSKSVFGASRVGVRSNGRGDARSVKNLRKLRDETDHVFLGLKKVMARGGVRIPCHTTNIHDCAAQLLHFFGYFQPVLEGHHKILSLLNKAGVRSVGSGIGHGTGPHRADGPSKLSDRKNLSACDGSAGPFILGSSHTALHPALRGLLPADERRALETTLALSVTQGSTPFESRGASGGFNSRPQLRELLSTGLSSDLEPAFHVNCRTVNCRSAPEANALVFHVLLRSLRLALRRVALSSNSNS